MRIVLNMQHLNNNVTNPNRKISEKELKDIEEEIIAEEKELANKKQLLDEEKNYWKKKGNLKKY